MTTIGVLGAGQLGRMLALAGYSLGLRFRFLDPEPDAPAGQVGEQVVGGFEDLHCLEKFASGLDLVTYEFENVPVELAVSLSGQLPVFPPPAALEASQDRLTEKQLFRRLGIPTAPFLPISSLEDLEEGVKQLGLPAILKTRRFGYDGRGQALIRTHEEMVSAWDLMGQSPLILEGFVSFDRELSLIAVRGSTGEKVYYPLVENQHHRGMLRMTQAPASGVGAELEEQAKRLVDHVLGALDYVGALAVELFQQGSLLIANEMAPRVHNSGHWTIDGAVTSQFENHLRAILGWPLGPTTPVGSSVMINVIGQHPDVASVLAVQNAHLHLYGKQPRPARKLGHVTLVTADPEILERGARQLQALLPEDLDSGD